MQYADVRSRVSGNFAELALTNLAGQPLPVYYFRGNWYVEAIDQLPFKIVLYNRTRGKQAQVVAVDGMNALKREPAATTGRGMIVNPHGSTPVDGWRVDNTEVKQFVFTLYPNEGVAAANGRIDAIGTIAIAVWTEVVKQEPYLFATRSAEPTSMGLGDETFGAKGITRSAVGAGARQQSNVRDVEFERDSLVETLILNHRSRAWLVANGIIYSGNPSPSGSPFVDLPGGGY